MSNLKTNTTSLQELLTVVNNLPEASNGVELPDLTNEGTAADLLIGKELIDGEGNVVTGTFTIDEELSAQATLLSNQGMTIARLADILNTKASCSAPTLQSKTVTPTKAPQTITADSEYDGLSEVIVSGDTNLIDQNIRSGVSIFGVSGSYEGSGNSDASIATCTLNFTQLDPSGKFEIWYHTYENGAIVSYYKDINASIPATLTNILCNSLIVVYKPNINYSLFPVYGLESIHEDTEPMYVYKVTAAANEVIEVMVIYNDF